MNKNPPIQWPPKHNVCGVQVSATTYDEAVESIMDRARRRQLAVTSFFAVHAVVTHARDRSFLPAVNRFDLVAPDGQPVRWALNWLHGCRLPENVRGSEIMWRLCARAAEQGVSIYLYGGSPQTIEALKGRLTAAFPDLTIAGAESPPFRPLTPQEDDEVVARINNSGAGLVFVGLGCPKQDHFASAHYDRIDAVQVCVGAAFDFHAGNKRTAPTWMQRHGLEWVFRLSQESGRLWRRYLVTNTLFVKKLLTQWIVATTRLGHYKRPPMMENSTP